MARSRRAVVDTDESDIVEKLGAEPVDPEEPHGPMVADEKKVLEAGAVDTESIQANRIADANVNRIRGGEKGVHINEPLLQKYETLTRLWPVNSLSILVKRLTGTAIEWPITSQPRTAVELYAAIKALHGRHEEATYEVFIRDSAQKTNRGQGRITMPDTRDELPPQSPQGQPMYPPQYGQPQPPQYGQPQLASQPQQQQPAVQVVPPTVDPIAMMQQMFQIFQQMNRPQQPQPVAPQPQQPPTVQVVPPAVDPMAMMQQMFQMFQQMQPPPQAPQAAAPPPPPPPSGSDPIAMMAWMQKMFQQMQASAQPAPQPQPAQPQFGMPPVQPPPGMFFIPGFGYVPVQRLFEALSGAAPHQGPPASGPGQYRGAAYGGPRPQGDHPYPHQQPPTRPKTAAEEFREAASVVDMAINLSERFRPSQPVSNSPPEREEDDSPVRVINMGPAKGVINEDGSLRGVETFMANLPDILKWVGEQREAIQKSNRETKQQRRQLPPGYIEVTPDYKPPPGYVAVPVDRLPDPPPPDEMPPPIDAPPPAEEPKPWGMPPMPGDGQ